MDHADCLQRVLDYYDLVDESKTIEDFVPRRFITLTDNSSEGGYWVETYDTLKEACKGLEEESLGNWWPYALFDCENGKSLPLSVKVIVELSDDPGAVVAEDLH